MTSPWAYAWQRLERARLEAERRLREEEARYRRLVSSTDAEKAMLVQRHEDLYAYNRKLLEEAQALRSKCIRLEIDREPKPPLPPVRLSSEALQDVSNVLFATLVRVWQRGRAVDDEAPPEATEAPPE